jgi:hypothetical protein
LADTTRICSRCVMDSSIPGIQFDPAGKCNYCGLHDRMEASHHHREGTVDQLSARIRKSGRKLDYDCVVGLSGGTDSTYCLYVTKKLGLRPLAVHFDNGFVSETATANIKATTDRLNVDVRTVKTDWQTLRGLYRACLEASIPEICLPCEVGVYSALHHVAAEVGARYIVLGLSYKTEGITPLAWHYCDGLYFADVLKSHGFGDSQPRGFDGLGLMSFARHALWRGIRTIQLPLYMREYRDKEVQAELAKELGWVYGGHHHFDCAYKPFVAHIQARKFDIDYRKVTLSALIRTGQGERGQALTSLREVPTATDAEIAYCLDRLELTPADLERILSTPTRSFRDYRSYYSLVSRMKVPLRVMSRLGVVPETTYEKLFET